VLGQRPGVLALADGPGVGRAEVGDVIQRCQPAAAGRGRRGHDGPRRPVPVRGEDVVAREADHVRVADGPGVVRAARGDAEQALVLADDVRRGDLLPLRAVPALGEDLQARVVAGPLELADRPGVAGGTRGDGVKRASVINPFSPLWAAGRSRSHYRGSENP